MKRVLAISGGVDSMVLLDFCVKNYPKNELIVAHFNHGTRQSCEDDEKFLKKICAEKNVEIIVGYGELGEGVSEERAREKRYEFLREVAKKNQGCILTAHHLDDLCESIAINLIRGTGWRGLAVLNAGNIERPLIDWARKDILKYAAENEVVFREDPTNSSEKYLRNRIRESVRSLPKKTKENLLNLRNKQVEIEPKIEEIVREILPKSEKYAREIFQNVDDKIGMELVRFILKQENISATRPQISNFLDAIRTYNSGKYFNLPNDRLVKISKKYFML